MADDQQVCFFFPVGLFCVVFLLLLLFVVMFGWLVFSLPSLFSPEQFRVELKVLNLHF